MNRSLQKFGVNESEIYYMDYEIRGDFNLAELSVDSSSVSPSKKILESFKGKLWKFVGSMVEY